MPTQLEYLEQDLAKSIKEFGPDSASAKHLRAQIASLGTVRHPSQLAALKSSKNDKCHGAMLDKQSEVPPDMDNQQQMASLQDSVDKMIASWDESTSPAPTTPGNDATT